MTDLEQRIENKLSDLCKNNISAKKIILFGAGVYSRQLYKLLKDRGHSVYAVIDNNERVSGHPFENLVVQQADTFLKKFSRDYIFLILSRFYPEMKKQLEEYGYRENIHFFQMTDISSIDEWHLIDQDRLDKCILSVKYGREVHERLISIYGKEVALLVNPVASIGDIYLMSFYVQAYLKNNPNSIFVFGSRTLEKLANQLSFGTVIYMNLDDVQSLIDYAKVFGFEKVNIKLLHTGYIHFRIWSRMLTYIGLTWMEHYRELFGLPENSEINVTRFPSDTDAEKIFLEQGMIPGKTVVLSPYANTVRQFSKKFWEVLAERLLSLGYCVCTNLASESGEAISGTIPTFVDIDKIISFVETAGYFIGIRSGLCDILCTCECLKIILYSDEIFDLISVFDFYSMEKMGFGRNVIEFVVQNEKKTQEEIMRKMQKEIKFMNERTVAFQNIVEYDGKLWFWDRHFNGLFYCRNHGNYAAEIPLKHNMNTVGGSLYGKILLYRHKIIGIPKTADSILVYDIVDRRENYIEICGISWGVDTSEKGKFLEYVIDGRYAFFIGYGSPVILKFDMEQEVIDNYIELCTEDGEERKEFFFISGMIQEKKLYVPDEHRYIVYEIDVDTMKSIEHKIEKKKGSQLSVYVDKSKDEIWLMPLNIGPCSLWNRQIKNTKFYLFPFQTVLEILIFDSEKKYFFLKEWSFEKSMEEHQKDGAGKPDHLYERFFQSQKCEDYIYLYVEETKELIVYRPSDGTMERRTLYLSCDDFRKYAVPRLSFKMREEPIVSENIYTISDFINYEKNNFSNHIMENTAIESMGGSIFKLSKERL